MFWIWLIHSGTCVFWIRATFLILRNSRLFRMFNNSVHRVKFLLVSFNGKKSYRKASRGAKTAIWQCARNILRPLRRSHFLDCGIHCVIVVSVWMSCNPEFSPKWYMLFLQSPINATLQLVEMCHFTSFSWGPECNQETSPRLTQQVHHYVWKVLRWKGWSKWPICRS